jgi:CheY-like chemotaxis protein
MRAERPLVLIVDDDDDLRELVRALVGLLEVDTATAEHGVAALTAIEQRRPDLMVLDMKMPVMDGWELCRELDRRGDGRPPSLVMTAAPDPSERAAEVGAQAYLGKPFETDELLGHVRRLLHVT